MTNEFSARTFINMWHTLALVPYAAIVSLSIPEAVCPPETQVMLHAVAAAVLLLLYTVFRNIAKIDVPLYPVAIILHAATICLMVLSWNEAMVLAAASMLLSALIVIEYRRRRVPYNRNRENDRDAWFAKREFFFAGKILAFIYAILFIAIVIRYRSEGNAVWRQSAIMFAGIIHIAAVMEFFRARYVACGKYKKRWIAVVDDRYKVAGRIKAGTAPLRATGDYMLMTVRIIAFEGRNIYIENAMHADGTLAAADTPFTSMLGYGENYEECLGRASKGVLENEALRYVTKYKYRDAHGDRVVLFYLYNTGKAAVPFDCTGGRFRSIEELRSAKPGEISDILRAELNFLGNTFFGI